MLRTRGGKTDQLGETTSRILTRSESKWLCPVRTAWALASDSAKIKTAGNAPICQVQDGSANSAAEVAKRTIAAATRCEEDISKFGAHSLRSGGATAMLAAGSSETTVKLHGRWESDCFQRYIDIDRTTSRNLATQMLDE
ncbi:hypothetical protein PI124_g404 [Phytophthora idaei]|nr:hypothetical protein PI124_g404 [Phytophthora idaei]